MPLYHSFAKEARSATALATHRANLSEKGVTDLMLSRSASNQLALIDNLFEKRMSDLPARTIQNNLISLRTAMKKTDNEPPIPFTASEMASLRILL